MTVEQLAWFMAGERYPHGSLASASATSEVSYWAMPLSNILLLLLKES